MSAECYICKIDIPDESEICDTCSEEQKLKQIEDYWDALQHERYRIEEKEHYANES